MCRHGIVPNVITCNAGQQRRRTFHLLRAVQRHAIGREMITNNAASDRLRQQALHLLRTMLRHDVVPNVITYSAAIRVGRAPASPAGFSSLTGGAVPRHRAEDDLQQRSYWCV